MHIICYVCWGSGPCATWSRISCHLDLEPLPKFYPDLVPHRFGSCVTWTWILCHFDPILKIYLLWILVGIQAPKGCFIFSSFKNFKMIIKQLALSENHFFGMMDSIYSTFKLQHPFCILY